MQRNDIFEPERLIIFFLRRYCKIFVVTLLTTPLLREGAYATRTEISRDILLSPKIHKDELSGG